MTQLLVTSKDMVKAHRAFLGVDPSSTQSRIYEAFPEFRGVNNSFPDEEIFEATAISSIVQAFTMKQVEEPHQVHLFVTASNRAWTVQRLRVLTQTVFSRLKERKDAKHAPAVGKLFHAILMGTKVLPFETPPERWACFGFVASDPIPPWMRSGLLVL